MEASRSKIELLLQRSLLFLGPVFVPLGTYVTSLYGGLLGRGPREVILYSLLSLLVGGLVAFWGFRTLFVTPLKPGRDFLESLSLSSLSVSVWSFQIVSFPYLGYLLFPIENILLAGLVQVLSSFTFLQALTIVLLGRGASLLVLL